MPAPTLQANKFHVWLDQPSHEDADSHGFVHHVVMVRTGDQLRAELEANKLRLPAIKSAPLHATALWLWATCARLGLTESPAETFISAELVSYQPDKEGDEAVGPTVPPAHSE